MYKYIIIVIIVIILLCFTINIQQKGGFSFNDITSIIDNLETDIRSNNLFKNVNDSINNIDFTKLTNNTINQLTTNSNDLLKDVNDSINTILLDAPIEQIKTEQPIINTTQIPVKIKNNTIESIDNLSNTTLNLLNNNNTLLQTQLQTQLPSQMPTQSPLKQTPIPAQLLSEIVTELSTQLPIQLPTQMPIQLLTQLPIHQTPQPTELPTQLPLKQTQQQLNQTEIPLKQKQPSLTEQLSQIQHDILKISSANSENIKPLNNLDVNYGYTLMSGWELPVKQTPICIKDPTMNCPPCNVKNKNITNYLHINKDKTVLNQKELYEPLSDEILKNRFYKNWNEQSLDDIPKCLECPPCNDEYNSTTSLWKS